MNGNYTIIINDKIIGTSKLEKADAPMGVVFGEVFTENNGINYQFILDLCRENSIPIISNSPKGRVIQTGNIQSLIIKSENGTEINGIGKSISGMDSDKFEVEIVGIPYPFFEEQFPEHVKEYNNLTRAKNGA